MKRQMKRLLVIAIAGIVITTGCGSRQSSEYPLTTTVVELNTDSDVVVTEDFNGNKWEFTGIEDWMVGDICSMIMSDNGTESIYDDTIVMTRYNGWVE